MAFISVTRVRLRSILYVPQFAWYSLKSVWQAERAQGFLGGRVMRDAGYVFWTLTAWETDAAMRAYRDADAHMKAMPRLFDWCDESSVAHWQQEDAQLPTWREAHRRMVAEGWMPKVRHPSPAQEAKRIAEPRRSREEGKKLKRARTGAPRPVSA